MAYGNLKCDNLIYDDNGTDTVVSLAHVGGKAPLASPTFTGDVTINAQGDLRLADSDSSNYVGFQSPATVASNVVWTLPDSDGSSGQLLQTDGSGTLSWSTTDLSAYATLADPNFTGTVTVGNNFTFTDPSDGGSGYNAILTQSGDGSLTLRGKVFELQDSSNSNAKWLKCNTAAGTELYHADSKKLETTTDGIHVINELSAGGTVNAPGIREHAVGIDHTNSDSWIVNRHWLTDTSTQAFTMTLPASPAVGDYFKVSDETSSWATNNLTLARNGNNIQSAAADLVCNVNMATVKLLWTGNATAGWIVS